MQTVNRNVFDKVRKTFQKIALSAVSEDQQNLSNLVLMNTPPLAARRDSAYNRAIELLRQHIFAMPEQSRSLIYEAILKLLEEAVDATRAITLSPLAGKEPKVGPGPMLQYLLLLKHTLTAASALVHHELILFQDEKSLTSFIGSEISSQFISTEEIFSNSEMNVYHSINDLVDLAEPAIKRHREQRKRSFSKADLARYHKSLAEFQTLHNKIGRIDDEEKA